MAISLVTPAASFPVTLPEAKAQCRVDSDDEDDLIDGLIAAATAHVEKYCGRSILEQSWALTLPKFRDEIALPYGPVTSATIAYYDAAGVEQSLATGWLLHDSKIVKTADASWPATESRPDAVTITFDAGEAAAPTPVKQALLLLIQQWFDNRAPVGDKQMMEMPHAVDALLCNYRNFATAE